MQSVKIAAESKKEKKNLLGNGLKDTDTVKASYTTTLIDKKLNE